MRTTPKTTAAIALLLTLGMGLSSCAGGNGSEEPSPQASEPTATDTASPSAPAEEEGTASPAPSAAPTAEAGASPKVAAPQNEEQAIKDAQAAFLAFSDMANQVALDGGKNPDRLKLVSQGPILEDQMDVAVNLEKKSWRGTGNITNEFVFTHIGDVRTENPPKTHKYQSATMRVCRDGSNVGLVDSNNEEQRTYEVKRFLVDVTAEYVPSEGRWLVNSLKLPSDEVRPC